MVALEVVMDMEGVMGMGITGELVTLDRNTSDFSSGQAQLILIVMYVFKC